jgi:hypothetical protein
LQEIDQQLVEIDLKLQLLAKINEALKGEIYEKLPLGSNILEGAINELVAQYNQTIFEKENFLEAATESNPATSTYNEQLDNIRENILLSINSLQSDLNAQK